MALDLQQLRDFDNGRLSELDRRVDDDINHELGNRKRVVEESRAKKRKKAQKQRRATESAR